MTPGFAKGLRSAAALAAVGATVALGSSTARIASLPGRGASLDAMGASAKLDVARAAVVLDEDQGFAWLVGEAAACVVDLANEVFPACVDVAAAQRPVVHAAADGVLFLAAADPRAPRDAVAFAFTTLDELGHARTGFTRSLDLPDDWQRGAVQTNAAWDAPRHEFLVAFDWSHEGDRRLVRVPVGVARGLGEPGVLRLAAGLPPIRAAFAGATPRVLYVDRTIHEGDRVERLPIPAGACVGGASVSCVEVQGSAVIGDERALSVLVTATGEALRVSALPGAIEGAALRSFEASPSRPEDRELALDSPARGKPRPIGVATPRIASRVRPIGCASAACERLIVPTSIGDSLSLEVRRGGGESVLFARRDAGPLVRVASDASPVDAWTLLPWRDGAVAIDAGHRVAVGLDRDLRVVFPKRDRAATIAGVLQDRYARDDLDLKAAVVAWLGWLCVLWFGARAGFARAALPVGAWSLLVALWMVVQRSELFPP